MLHSLINCDAAPFCLCHDDVIEEPQAHSLRSLPQPDGYESVGLAWLRFAVGVVVRDAERCATRGQYEGEHITHWHQAAISGSLGQQGRADHRARPVADDHQHSFSPQAAQQWRGGQR